MLQALPESFRLRLLDTLAGKLNEPMALLAAIRNQIVDTHSAMRAYVPGILFGTGSLFYSSKWIRVCRHVH